MIETKVGSFEPEQRMLIDGELAGALSGKQFDNINPATEEVLGQVADGGHEDMSKAIAAARCAFDETDWSTSRAFRKRCLEQLQEAVEAEREQLRAELVAEVGAPVMTTHAAQLDLPLEDAFRWPAKEIAEFAWERELETKLVGIAG
jgi:aldehyde dehydrogenase (NAD+)